MRFYTGQHRFYCGIDLHARTMYVCIVDQAGNKLVHENVACNPKAFLKVIAPYRDDVAVSVECMFTWYWLADLCAEHKIAFVLGHALYMKAIHGGKAKNDKIDSGKIAHLLRGGNLPACPSPGTVVTRTARGSVGRPMAGVMGICPPVR